ncbi:SPOR domain-containing protein [Thermoflavimicrobium dichotomicum]|uniref:Sporulation related domain-containing protein n=1 Tax=Thermoflavimicrobium dichotomicum TaxID=46223 RepID=A0A1I3LIH2_9BACL|nr:SPOR domain-containing protein [Thermoflavimicrobium dichotomicum]SFI84558.1 Sporulation related domain-containing protein [Thermoflavimicrobium dichotomicum]
MKLKRLWGFLVAFALMLAVGVPHASAAGGSTPGYKPKLHYVYAGSFLYKQNAYNRAAALKKQGYDAFVKVAYVNGKKFYRVQVGVFYSPKNTNKYVKKLKKKGFDGVFVVKKQGYIPPKKQ